ncbi:hypothetical protein WMZ97_04045 [Lentibacillus sp. N15]|uniref:hypothetical protein n=1 Tax=Lentibacillus songyuanensis TaxID=3136161 RepID=UPI0031BBCDA4
MAIASKLMTIGVVVFSLAIGIVTFYIFSQAPKDQKGHYIGELVSQMVNFVIFMWIGKVLLHFSIFVTDPLAILAYPSDSSAFYFAVLCIAFLLLYKSSKRKIDILGVIGAFLPVFLIASFTYSFIQLVWNHHTYAFGQLILLMILAAAWLGMPERLLVRTQIFLLLTGWTAGVLLLYVFQPYVTVFGYIVTPWFVGLFYIISVVITLWNRKERE